MGLALHAACERGDTERVRQLLGDGVPVDEKGWRGRTALMYASRHGYTEVVQLLLSKDAPVGVKDVRGWTALIQASMKGHTKVVQLLLSKGAPVDEKGELCMTALMWASKEGHTEVVQLLLGKGAAIDEQEQCGWTALMLASMKGHTEVVQILVDNGAAIDVEKTIGGWTTLPAFDIFDEEQLGRMAAILVHCQLQKAKRQDWNDALDATATAVLQLVRLAEFVRERARKLRSSDPHSADNHEVLFGRLQLAAAACIHKDWSGKDRRRSDAHHLLCSDNGRKALEHASQIKAKELLAQPVVQGYMMVTWRGDLVNLGWAWIPALLLLLLQLLFVLPLVALVPPLDRLLRDRINKAKAKNDTHWSRWGYLLRLPVVKFGLECAADLALALALTIIPAADLGTAPIGSLLLAWVGSGLLWEARQAMAFSSYATSQLTRLYDRLATYWADRINKLDDMALIFSFAALTTSLSSTSDNGDATATALRVVAVFLLWSRLIRVLLVSPRFGPYALMFYRMLVGDLISFLVILAFLILAFAASWTVLLEPEPSALAQQFGNDQNWRWNPSYGTHLETAGCADELGGLDIVSTLQTLVEGALTWNDFFECARDSTKSPWVAWVISAGFVMLTSVLLLNMLIAMCAAVKSRRITKIPFARTSCGAHHRLCRVCCSQDGQDLRQHLGGVGDQLPLPLYAENAHSPERAADAAATERTGAAVQRGVPALEVGANSGAETSAYRARGFISSWKRSSSWKITLLGDPCTEDKAACREDRRVHQHPPRRHRTGGSLAHHHEARDNEALSRAAPGNRRGARCDRRTPGEARRSAPAHRKTR